MFQFGPPVKGEELFDREEEVRALVHSLKTLSKGGRVDYALIGVRRVGKTSILNKVIEITPKEGVVPVFVNCEGLRFEDFIVVLGAAILEKFTESLGGKEKLLFHLKERLNKTPAEAIAVLSEALGSVRTFNLKLAADYIELLLELKQKEAAAPVEKAQLRGYFDATINLPEQLAIKYKKFFMVFLDEFQTTARYHPDFFAWMRRNTQMHTRVGYIVSGSNIGMMKDIVLDYSQPFGGNFMIQWIHPFDHDMARQFLKTNFKEEKLKISDRSITEIISFTAGYPAYLSWIGDHCVHAKRTDLEYIHQLEKEIFKPHNLGYFFERELARLQKAGQTKILGVLKTMAIHGLSSPSKIARNMGGISASNVINYLRRLEKYGYVDRPGKGKYAILDPMLEKYLKAEAASF